MKTYRGSPAAARIYVESGRSRADDYYLAEGSGVAARYVASPGGGVRSLASLTGDGYEAWVAGVDPDTGQPKGRLRADAAAVRFVEVVVNGPKSWSLAAELHPEISAAYDAAQDLAATQIITWVAQHACTRVGPRGGQIQVPVTEIEAVTVRHYTSRAGDPHRHLHLQINARVLAEDAWRGLHTVGVRDSLDAINGIGHAAVMTDPSFRAALAAYGFTLDPGTGEVRELAEFVAPFSARTAQISRNIDRYEAAWRAVNPGREPGPALRRAWDARAWGDARPDKIVPADGAELTQRWVQELHELGYRDRGLRLLIDASRVGRLDRDHAVGEVLSRLAARRSGWNAADIRGEVEQLIARANIVTDASIRGELAEDLTARTVAACEPLLARTGLPEHIRALTSPHVLDVEADLVARFAKRGATPWRGPDAIGAGVVDALDPAQQAVVRALASDVELIVIEGAAGAGKTATLAAARAAIERHGGRLRVITPTLKAARVAARKVGGDASSAAWLAHHHGFRWHENGTWTRLQHGDVDASTGAVYTGPRAGAALAAGDLLVIDEAGMLDQDTARALLTIADEHHWRVAMVGDRHQLPAVGRGGVLDLAARHVHPDAHRELDTVHRFTRTITAPDGRPATVPDQDYAQLSLAMRTADNPATVFDALLARDQIRVHANDNERVAALSQHAARARQASIATVVVADTNEQVAALNDAVRAELVAAGRVDDAHTTTGHTVRIGAGDCVVTRRNDPDLQVANRDVWTVTGVDRDGSVSVTGERGERILPTDYVRQYVELGYASTVHGVQGDTATAAHLAVGEHTSAASAYVGMTRGREANTAHLIAENLDDAREQWVAVFARGRADLGPAHAAELAAGEAERYAQLRPLDHVLSELRDAWTIEANAQTRLTDAQHRRDLLRDIVAITEQRDAVVPALRRDLDAARAAAERTAAQLRPLEVAVTSNAEALVATLKSEWEEQRQPARDAAQTVRHGNGRLGQRRAAVREAHEYLDRWAQSWRPYLPAMPASAEQVAGFAAWFDDTARHHESFDTYARAAAEQAHPDYLRVRDVATDASQAKSVAWHELREAERHYSMALQHHGVLGSVDDPHAYLAQVEEALVADSSALAGARDQIAALRAEPTLRAQPDRVVDTARDLWALNRGQRASWRAVRAAAEHEADRAAAPRSPGWDTVLEISHDEPERGISR